MFQAGSADDGIDEEQECGEGMHQDTMPYQNFVHRLRGQDQHERRDQGTHGCPPNPIHRDVRPNRNHPVSLDEIACDQNDKSQNIDEVVIWFCIHT